MLIATSSMVPQRTNRHVCFIFPLKDIQLIPVYNIAHELITLIPCVNNQYFEFQEMQLN